MLRQKEQIQNVIHKATPEQLGKMLEMFQSMGIGNIVQQRVVMNEEAEKLITAGWKFVGILPTEKS